MNRLVLVPAAAAIVLLPACVPLQVAVPKPVKIDVNMKVDVTTRSEGAAPGTAPAASGAVPGSTSTNATAPKPIRGLDVVPDANAARTTPAGAAASLHARLGEIQSLKNDRLIGENNKGYLEVRQKPDGKLASGEAYAAYVDRIVQEVNDDRKVLYQARADKSGDPIETHEQQSAQRRRDSAFTGEWIQDANGTWKQK